MADLRRLRQLLGCRRIPESFVVVELGAQEFPTMGCDANEFLTGGSLIRFTENAFNVVTASIPTEPGIWKWNFKNSDSAPYVFITEVICIPTG